MLLRQQLHHRIQHLSIFQEISVSRMSLKTGHDPFPNRSTFTQRTTTNRQARAEVFDRICKKKKNSMLSRCLALFEITELRSKLLGNHNCDN